MSTEGLAQIKLVAHEPGDQVVFMKPDGVFVSVTRNEGVVTRTENGSTIELFNGSAESARKVIDATAENAGAHATKVRSSRSDWSTPSPVKTLAACLLVVAALGSGVMLSLQQPKTSDADLLGTKLAQGQTVEEANAARGPAPAPEPVAPAQPQIELPNQVHLEDIPTDIAAGERVLQEIQAATPSAPAAEQSAEAGALDPTVPAVAAADPNNPLASRVAEAEQNLQAAAADARASVADTGADKAATDVEQMKQALEMLNSGSKIPPSIAEKLPHDLAQQLRAAGAIMTPEEVAAASTGTPGAPNFKITKIPANIVDGYRDADGIASIPEQDSWLAAGGSVRLPLPGGGDIFNVEDFESFFLQP